MTKLLDGNRVVKPLTAALLAGLLGATLIPVGAFAADPLPKGSIRFTWWGATTRNQKTEQIIKLFEAANPGATISAEPGDFNTYWDKLTVQSASGNQPCSITMQSRYLAQYADPAILKPLDDMVKSGELETAGVDPAVLDSARGPDGKLYFIPSGVFYFTLLMNKTDIEKAGMQLPPSTWTWDDYATYVKQLQSKLPAGVHASGNLGNEFDGFTEGVQAMAKRCSSPTARTLGRAPKPIAGLLTYWEALRKAGITWSRDGRDPEHPDRPDAARRKGIGRLMAPTCQSARRSPEGVERRASGQQLAPHTYPLGPSGQGNDIGSNGSPSAPIAATTTPRSPPPGPISSSKIPTPPNIYASDNGVVSVRQVPRGTRERSQGYGGPAAAGQGVHRGCPDGQGCLLPERRLSGHEPGAPAFLSFFRLRLGKRGRGRQRHARGSQARDGVRSRARVDRIGRRARSAGILDQVTGLVQSARRCIAGGAGGAAPRPWASPARGRCASGRS